MSVVEDNKLFRSLGFFKSFNLKLYTDSSQFRTWFYKNVGTEINFFGRSKHNKDFHGDISTSEFKICKSMRMSDDSNIAYGQGAYVERNGVLKISVAIYIPITAFILYYGMASISVLIMIMLAVTEENFSGLLAVVFGSFTIFFYFWIAFIFRKRVNELSSSIEKEFARWSANE